MKRNQRNYSLISITYIGINEEPSWNRTELPHVGWSAPLRFRSDMVLERKRDSGHGKRIPAPNLDERGPLVLQ